MEHHVVQAIGRGIACTNRHWGWTANASAQWSSHHSGLAVQPGQALREDLPLALAALHGEVAHQIVVDIAEDVVVIRSVAGEIERRRFSR